MNLLPERLRTPMAARIRRRAGVAGALDVAGAVVLITGGADGIGLALARLLHARGATVALLDVNREALAAVESELSQRVLTEPVDVRDRSAVDAAVRSVVDRAGGVDVVVANAGVTPPAATLRQIEPADFDRVIDINLTGVFNTVRASEKAVIQRGGHVVVVSSAAAFTPGPGGAAYMVSKAAVEQLGRALRLELAGHGVSVGIAYFGFVDTGLARTTLDGDPLGSRLQELLPTPLRKRISPERAAAVLAGGIARRAGSTVSPRIWGVWGLLRGPMNAIGDRILAANNRLQHLVTDLESESDRQKRDSALSVVEVTESPDSASPGAGAVG